MSPAPNSLTIMSSSFFPNTGVFEEQTELVTASHFWQYFLSSKRRVSKLGARLMTALIRSKCSFTCLNPPNSSLWNCKKDVEPPSFAVLQGPIVLWERISLLDLPFPQIWFHTCIPQEHTSLEFIFTRQYNIYSIHMGISSKWCLLIKEYGLQHTWVSFLQWLNGQNKAKFDTLIPNICTDGADSSRTSVHKRSNSAQIPCRNSFLSVLKEFWNSFPSGAIQICDKMNSSIWVSNNFP